MEEFEKIGGDRPSPAPGGNRVAKNGGQEDGKDSSADSIWEELRARREKAGRRIGEGWTRASEDARRYADDHSVGVALGSLGVGIALGLLIGVISARD
jgi:hypothetical protein